MSATNKGPVRPEAEAMQGDERAKSPMREIRIGKITLNIATGKSGDPLERAKKVLNQLTGKVPVTKKAHKAVKDFNVRKGEPIAAVVTLRD
ncbi:MAG TPA: 50S ribosomal protein L5, partial [Candidatus Binatus sp.]|nr:50S ribosomal protein L5 [Candidatus Binatus sp.]